MRVGLGGDKLGVDANLVARPPHAAFQYIAHAQLAADLLRVDRLVPIRECSTTRDHETLGDTGQIGRHVLGDPISEILLLRIVAEVGEGQHHDRQARRNRGLRCQRGEPHVRQAGGGLGAERINPYWPRDVFDALVAHVLEGEREPLADMVADSTRDADTARLSQRLQTRRDIHSVAEDVVLLDEDIAEIDAYAEPDPALLGHVGLAVGHPPLNLDRTSDGVDDALELRQEAIAGVLYNPAPVFLDLRIDQFPEMGLKPLMGPLLVSAHQARIPRHICCQDRGEAAFDTFPIHQRTCCAAAHILD